ncbi:Myo-inositol catabolism IolB domain protein [Nostocoides japonicum T1-X7]|uniref:Myo-inositol catabolism IolB domain protein n=1 Tax=Nostocoides japonicum T1-X7 TaxID=1194083 RepID=A0A077LYF3_9MICO|nr:5-deoxy-glucuronate isomerase [Tetrasphaera japonica]CCH78948.1 Myo-inositol catabolism IolB domain protein [Tetrasphaera japonica T1-X7]
MTEWVLPLGTAADGPWQVAIDDRQDGWTHTGLYVATLEPGAAADLDLGDREAVVVPLSGGAVVTARTPDGESHEVRLGGREGVFAGPTDVVYVPRGSTLTVSAAADTASRTAVATALATKSETVRSFRYLAVDEVPVELRGAGIASREVRNFGVPSVLDADSIIACEVVTPAGNWSSYPPHKHDVERAGEETELEEIYYFEVAAEAGAAVPDGADPVAYQRVYGSDERPIDVLAEVRGGDVVLVPHGWHGPAMAPPGYDLYYLNVMAGPGTNRAWLITDDPAHAWVRSTWPDQAVDPRLPMGGTR